MLCTAVQQALPSMQTSTTSAAWGSASSLRLHTFVNYDMSMVTIDSYSVLRTKYADISRHAACSVLKIGKVQEAGHMHDGVSVVHYVQVAVEAQVWAT